MEDVTAVLANAGRLAQLKAADLMDTPPDEEFDRLARLASKTLHAPVALVTLVDEDRQFFKSCMGLPEPWLSWRQTPLSHSFCQHVVATCQPLVISDARSDERVKSNLAIRDLGVIAYLGIPLKTPEGNCLGSFCVIDSVPRQWTEEEIWVVQTLAYSVMSEIELRRHRSRLQSMVDERTAQLGVELDRSRRLQEELHEALVAANNANEAKRRFIAALSHELRTPLTPALLYASSAERSNEYPPDARELFRMIREQIQLEARLIDELLQAADLGTGRIVPAMDRVDVHALLGRICESFSAEAKDKGIELEYRLEAPRPLVRADSTRLGQAFSHVLGNSLKFSPPQSRILVRTYPKSEGQAGRPAICIEFIDQGIGLEPDELARVFEAFWQKSTGIGRQYGGVGLGLTIARTLVEMHGGTLTAYSEGKDRGTTFAVCLPIAG